MRILTFNVVIEVSIGGEPIKYELDKAAGALFVDRFLHTSMRYPGNYGFIPHTLSEDGDPCDVIIANTHSIILSHGIALIPQRKSSLPTTKNRLTGPSEICALEFEGEFRRFGTYSVSATIDIDQSTFRYAIW